jgi:hypothetical protein
MSKIRSEENQKLKRMARFKEFDRIIGRLIGQLINDVPLFDIKLFHNIPDYCLN